MAVSGQSKQAMTMIDLLNVPSLSDPQMAPDGSQLLYVRGESDWEKSKQIRHIWRIEADGTNTLRMTSGGGGGEQSEVVTRRPMDRLSRQTGGRRRHSDLFDAQCRWGGTEVNDP